MHTLTKILFALLFLSLVWMVMLLSNDKKRNAFVNSMIYYKYNFIFFVVCFLIIFPMNLVEELRKAVNHVFKR